MVFIILCSYMFIVFSMVQWCVIICFFQYVWLLLDSFSMDCNLIYINIYIYILIYIYTHLSIHMCFTIFLCFSDFWVALRLCVIIVYWSFSDTHAGNFDDLHHCLAVCFLFHISVLPGVIRCHPWTGIFWNIIGPTWRQIRYSSFL